MARRKKRKRSRKQAQARRARMIAAGAVLGHLAVAAAIAVLGGLGRPEGPRLVLVIVSVISFLAATPFVFGGVTRIVDPSIPTTYTRYEQGYADVGGTRRDVSVAKGVVTRRMNRRTAWWLTGLGVALWAGFVGFVLVGMHCGEANDAAGPAGGEQATPVPSPGSRTPVRRD